jgi:opacity protein-like surface antigen
VLSVTPWFVAVFLLATASAFAADTPQFELAGSYAFMKDTTRSDSFPAGWAISAIGNVNSWIGVVAEVGGNHTSCDNCQRGPFASERFRGTNLDITIVTFMAGPRVASHANSLVTPFAQVLLGGSHIKGGIEWDGALNTGFTYQPGAGVDVRVAPGVALRLQGDYRIIRTSGRNNKESRFLGGVVLSRGTR